MIRRFVDGDIATSGRQFVEDAEAVAQGVRARLRLFLGEYFLDLQEGTPWFQSILGKTPQDIAEVTLKQRLSTTPGIRAIERFDFRTDRTQRRIAASAVVLDENSDRVSVDMDEEIV